MTWTVSQGGEPTPAEQPTRWVVSYRPRPDKGAEPITTEHPTREAALSVVTDSLLMGALLFWQDPRPAVRQKGDRLIHHVARLLGAEQDGLAVDQGYLITLDSGARWVLYESSPATTK